MPLVSDLCTAADVAADLGVAADAIIARCVSAASAAVAEHCGRTFERETRTEAPRGYGRRLLLLEHSPVTTVAQVLENGVALDAACYSFEGALLARRGGAWPAHYAVGGLVSDTPTEYLPNADVLSVTYTAGYITPGQVALDAATYPTATLPASVQEAAILEACALYRGRGRDADISSEALGDWSASYRERTPGQRLASPRAAALLEPHVRLRAM